MEIGMLDAITLQFKAASMGWSAVLAPFMHSFAIDLLMLEWSLFMLAWLCAIEFAVLFPALIRFLISSGLALYLIDHGAGHVDELFTGIKILGTYMGTPGINPSAIAQWGVIMADPITRSLAEQGMLSYLTSPASWVFGIGAELSLFLAFTILAFITMALLITSYVLIASTPFFVAFYLLSFSRFLTMGYIKLVGGTVAGLFVTQLVIAIVSEVAAQWEMSLRTKFLATGVSLTWDAYATVMMTGLVMCCLFVWIPLSFTRAMGGMVGEMAGGGMLRMAGYGAMRGLSGGGGGGGSDKEKDGGGKEKGSGGGGGKALGDSSGGGMGGMGAPKASQSSNKWGSRN